MCGLVGIAGKLALEDEKTLKRLLLFDYLRGPDSTGLAVRNKNTKEIEVLKMASHPLDFFDSRKLAPMLSGYTSDVFLGHNRAATKGKVCGLNAHPFECGHIVGAHNGTLHNDSWKELEELIGEQTEVDSKAIFLAIEKVGIDETIKHLYGAWALVWIDSEQGTLNILKNDQRPLWFANSPDFRKLYWASEWPMLQAAMALSDKEYPLWEDKEGFSFFPFKNNTLYSWNLKALNDELSTTKERKPTVRTVEEKEVPKKPVTNFTHTYTQGNTGGTNSYTNSNSTNPRTKSLLAFRGTNEDPFAGVMAEPRFLEIAQHDCSYCGNPVKFEEPGLYVYPDTNMVLCTECTGTEITKIYINASDFDFIEQVT